jgi:hypothetical protein
MPRVHVLHALLANIVVYQAFHLYRDSVHLALFVSVVLVSQIHVITSLVARVWLGNCALQDQVPHRFVLQASIAQILPVAQQMVLAVLDIFVRREQRVLLQWANVMLQD